MGAIFGNEFFNSKPQATAVAEDWPAAMGEEAFLGIAGDFVRLVEPHTEADVHALLINFLISAGVLFGRQAWTRADGRNHYPMEFAVLIGETGRSRKGTATSRVLNVMERVEEDYRELHVISGLSSGEGLIKGLQSDTAPDVSKGETAAVWVHRKLGYIPEFGLLLQVLKREGNTMSAILRQAWDAEELRVLTKTEPLSVRDFTLSILAHVTPEELLNALSTVDMVNGFANRFLFLMVRRSKFLPEGGGEINPSEIVSKLHNAVVLAKGRGPVERDALTKDFWATVYPELTCGQPGIRGALSSRAEAHVLRLSLLYALLDASEEIKLTHLRAALAVWNFCQRSINYVFPQRSGDADTNRILDAMAAGPISMTELFDVFKRNTTRDWLLAKMAQLVSKGYAAETSKEMNRKTVPAWRRI